MQTLKTSALALITAGTLALTGCGGDDGESGSTSKVRAKDIDQQLVFSQAASIQLGFHYDRWAETPQALVPKHLKFVPEPWEGRQWRSSKVVFSTSSDFDQGVFLYVPNLTKEEIKGACGGGGQGKATSAHDAFFQVWTTGGERVGKSWMRYGCYEVPNLGTMLIVTPSRHKSLDRRYGA